MSSNKSLCIRYICVCRVTNKKLRSKCIARKYTISTNHLAARNYTIDVTKKLIARIAFCQFSIPSDFHITIRYFNKMYHFILLILGEIYKNILSKAIINSNLLAVRVIRKYTERMLHNCVKDLTVSI
jgi:hypothetical protein